MPLKLGANSGFIARRRSKWCEAERATFTITADQTQPLLEAITALPEQCWRPLPDYALSDMAELRYQSVDWASPYRYIVKRALAKRKTGELYWKHSALVTN